MARPKALFPHSTHAPFLWRVADIIRRREKEKKDKKSATNATNSTDATDTEGRKEKNVDRETSL